MDDAESQWLEVLPSKYNFGARYFPKNIFPREASQMPISQDGNFPMKEKMHFPYEGSIKVFKFYILNKFPNFFLENTNFKKILLVSLS